MNGVFSLRTFLLIIVIGVSSCHVAPKRVYRMDPVAEGTIWLAGREYARVSDDDITVVLAYDETHAGHYVFDVEVTNQSSGTVLVEPRQFFYYALIDPDTTAHERRVFAMDPEAELLRIELAISREHARYASAEATDATFTMLDLFVDVATIGQKKTEEELDREDEEYAKRQVGRTEREVRHATRSTELVNLQQMWKIEALRKTTLPPEHTVRGQTYFRAIPGSRYIELHVPVGDSEVQQLFKVSEYRP